MFVITDNWVADPCGREHLFVCKRAASGVTPRPGITVPPTVAVTGYCPAGYFGAGRLWSFHFLIKRK